MGLNIQNHLRIYIDFYGCRLRMVKVAIAQPATKSHWTILRGIKMRRAHRVMAPGIIALAGMLTFGLTGTALAFHGGGVAYCDGCHSMHNSPDNPVEGTPNDDLLKGTDASSTCLNCHDGAGSERILSTDGSNFKPGGDFFWLTQSYTNGTETSNKDNMGHNVVAIDFGLTVDGTNADAPGGTYPSINLGCTSCHDPHGQVNGGTPNGQLPISVSGSYGEAPDAGTIAGNYRLLGDALYGAIAAAAPIAVVNDYTEQDADHPAYGQGMSEWCASCHAAYTGDFNKHGSGNLNTVGAAIATVYNAYVNTGDFTGVQATSYTALVPFERQEVTKTVLLAATTSTAGPDAGDNVMCLTCHRAHATAFNNATRWDMEHELLAEGWPTAANLIAMGAVANADYLGRDIAADFGDYQRSLCNKCHARD
jgi:cytochrome c2